MGNPIKKLKYVTCWLMPESKFCSSGVLCAHVMVEEKKTRESLLYPIGGMMVICLDLLEISRNCSMLLWLQRKGPKVCAGKGIYGIDTNCTILVHI